MQDHIRYRENRTFLRADRCSKPEGFEKFWRKVETIADKCKVDIASSKAAFKPQKRDVQFYDTQDFALYRNAFILRSGPAMMTADDRAAITN